MKGSRILKQSSSKSLEKKLARKMADLDAAIESRQQIEQKIKGLREEIETLQSTQLEQVFQQVKKSILKEGLHVDAEAIPGILQTIRENQEEETPSKHETAKENPEAENGSEDALPNHYGDSSLPQEEENEPDVTTFTGSRLP